MNQIKNEVGGIVGGALTYLVTGSVLLSLLAFTFCHR